jgi:hypothetical protein
MFTSKISMENQAVHIRYSLEEEIVAIAPASDSRQFFVLPQGYEGGGYYTYGTPGGGRSQYANPHMMSLINAAVFEWNRTENRKFGIGR